MEVKTKIKCALDIAEDALDEVDMWFPRSMHIQTRLLNSMCNVRPCKRQVLKCTSKTQVLCRIGHKRPLVGGELAMSVNGVEHGLHSVMPGRCRRSTAYSH
jgi:hypothetical protein